SGEFCQVAGLNACQRELCLEVFIMKNKILSILAGALVLNLVVSAIFGVFAGMFVGALENGAGSHAELPGMAVFGFLTFIGSFLALLKLELVFAVLLAIAYPLGNFLSKWLRKDENKNKDKDRPDDKPKSERVDSEPGSVSIKVLPPTRLETP